MPDTYTDYDLPAHWEPALLNADESTLDDHEFEAFRSWLSSEDPGICVDASEKPFFMNHHNAAAYVLACDCLRYTFRKPGI